MRVAILDIGTNSIIILALEIEGDSIDVRFEQALEPRLGENLHKSGKLSSRAIERTIRAASRLIKSTGWHKIDHIIGFGTYVLRAAENSQQFLDKFLKRTGVTVRVLSSEEEARLSCAGALIDLAIDRDFAVVDVGGGSTEISFCHGDCSHFVSLPIGAVTLAEQLELEQPVVQSAQIRLRDLIHESFQKELTDQKVPTVIGAGGTATSLAMVHFKHDEFNPEKIHGSSLSSAELKHLSENLFSKSIDDLRGILFFAPGRADIIAAGTAIYSNVLELFGAEKLVVSQKGVRWGLAQTFRSYI